MNTSPDEGRTSLLQVRIRPSEDQALRKIADKNDEPVSAVVRRALRTYIEENI
jgi:hypothetical protein